MFAALLARLIPIKAAAFGLLLAALVAGLIVQGARLNAAHAALANKVESIAALQALIAAQNAGIEAMKQDTDRREASAKKAVAEAKKVQERARARVANIEASPVPADCQGAMQWLVAQGAALESQP